MLMTLLRWIVYLLLASGAVLTAFLFAMRFADGPWGIVAGGAFQSGTVVEDRRPDCAVLRDRGEVQFQLLEPTRSRTTWVACYQDRVFIPSGYMKTTVGKLWKHWPYEAEERPDILLRVDDEIFPRRLQRLTEDPAIPTILSELGRKYLLPAGASNDERLQFIEGAKAQISDGNLWLFELVDRR